MSDMSPPRVVRSKKTSYLYIIAKKNPSGFVPPVYIHQTPSHRHLQKPEIKPI